MPRLVAIKGCGPMACCTYREVTAALDRAYAAPEDQPLPISEVFAALAREASESTPAPPIREPEPG